jgi:hypothetical protein
MYVSQITNSQLMPWNIGNKTNDSQGVDFASFLQNAINSQESINKNPIAAGILPDIMQIKDVSSLPDSEFTDMMASLKSHLDAKGIDTSRMPDFSQMSDSELSDYKIQIQEMREQKFEFMHSMITNSGIFGIGGTNGNSQINFMQQYYETLTSAISSLSNLGEEEEQNSGLQLPQIGNSSNNSTFTGIGVADIISLRRMFASSN